VTVEIVFTRPSAFQIEIDFPRGAQTDFAGLVEGKKKITPYLQRFLNQKSVARLRLTNYLVLQRATVTNCVPHWIKQTKTDIHG
jgi:hypothetical protein